MKFGFSFVRVRIGERFGVGVAVEHLLENLCQNTQEMTKKSSPQLKKKGNAPVWLGRCSASA